MAQAAAQAPVLYSNSSRKIKEWKDPLLDPALSALNKARDVLDKRVRRPSKFFSPLLHEEEESLAMAMATMEAPISQPSRSPAAGVSVVQLFSVPRQSADGEIHCSDSFRPQREGREEEDGEYKEGDRASSNFQARPAAHQSVGDRLTLKPSRSTASLLQAVTAGSTPTAGGVQAAAAEEPSREPPWRLLPSLLKDPSSSSQSSTPPTNLSRSPTTRSAHFALSASHTDLEITRPRPGRRDKTCSSLDGEARRGRRMAAAEYRVTPDPNPVAAAVY